MHGRFPCIVDAMVNARLPPGKGPLHLNPPHSPVISGACAPVFAILLSAVALLFAAVLPAQAQGQVGVPEIEKYFTRFAAESALVQTNPTARSSRHALLRRPAACA